MADFPRPLVPDELFYRAVQRVFIKPNGSISPGAFSNTKGTSELSVDWDHLSTPEETIGRFPQWELPKGVVAVTAQQFWNCEQTLVYDPIPGNPAHSSVHGEKTGSTRRQLARGLLLIHVVE